MALIILKNAAGKTLERARYNRTRQWCRIILEWAEKYPDYAPPEHHGGFQNFMAQRGFFVFDSRKVAL